MLRFFGRPSQVRQGVTRRDVLRVGALGMAGLSLADVLRLRAAADTSAAARHKSVILIWQRGGPSHIDSFDMKPAAPAEIRGEFQPIATKVPGIQICEHLPKLAGMMDKLAIVRGIKSNDLGDHTPHYIVTGFPDRGKRPAIGSIVSYLRPRSDGLPPYVSLMYEENGSHENATYTGPAHRPFVPRDDGIEDLSLARGVSLERLGQRRNLLRQFDSWSREVESRQDGNRSAMAGIDVFTQRAMEMITSPEARDAFDLSQESDETRARYGGYCENLLVARRLAEAGVNVITLKVGDWDTHEHNFRDMRDQLRQLDQGFCALVNDLHDRGLQDDVAVVLWGEFGRDPRISRIAGRDHWPNAGAAVLAGGGFRVGQAIGETDKHAGRSIGRPYTPSNVFENLYRHLGIDTAATIPDRNNRPMHVLDDREPVRELG